MEKEFRRLRYAFSRCAFSAHKQMGLRAVQEALWLKGVNAEREAELLAKARFHLSYAKLCG